MHQAFDITMSINKEAVVRWAVLEERDGARPVYHVPDVGSWTTFSAVDVARTITAGWPVRPGPNGPIDMVEPRYGVVPRCARTH